MSLRTLLISSAALIAGAAAGAGAGAATTTTTTDPALLQSLHWRSIGPFRGGRVLTVTGVPGDPHHFYFGAVNGGVWDTVDAGRTWTPIFDAAPVGSVGAIAVAPSDPRILYVGTGEADMRSDIAQGTGMYRSADAGRTWQPIGLTDSQQIGRILVDPNNPDVLLVAALGHPYGANETRGVFRSTDGGKNWARTLYKDADTGAIDLAAEPGRPNVVYASLWQTRRPPWSVYPPSSGPGSGLYKSVNGGQTWTALKNSGLPERVGRIGIAVSASEPSRVYALVDSVAGGLYRSEDAGDHWSRVTDDNRIWKRGWYFGGVTVDPTNADIVYICNTAMYRSEDGGKTFVPTKGAPGGDDYHQLWIDPSDPRRQMLGVDQGAVITLDAGTTWSSWFNQPTGQFYHVITDHRFPYWVYGSQQDSGAAGIPSRTDHIDGINLTHFRETTAGGESDNIAPDPDDPQVLFGGRVDRVDLRTGLTQSVDPTLAHPDLYRGEWTQPLVFGKTGRRALYFGNQRIFRTGDDGRHWDVISPDLTRENPSLPATLDAATIADDEHAGPRRGVVYAIGPSPLDEKLLWAGTDDGLVWRSLDGGRHWRDVTPAGLGAWSKIGVVEPSHFDKNSAYIAVDRHRLDDQRPYVYRTHDGGSTWTLIADGIADGGALNAVNVVREDPVHRGLLYCGTERGVYVSFDDGSHWQALQRNLPRTSVRDLEVRDGDLVIATHGRGFWIMDNIAPLRTLAGAPGPGTRLLPPAPALRLRPIGFTGSPMPKDEPRGDNPPLGAYVDYMLAGDAHGPVRLTVTDAHGTVVRGFSSDDPRSSVDPARADVAPGWFAPRQPLATSNGAHRVVWDLHYAPKAALVSDFWAEEQESGIWVPPGQYSLELSVDGTQYRQPLTVAADPRVKMTPAAYTQQFALAGKIEQARVEIATALVGVERLRTALAERGRGANTVVAVTLADAGSVIANIDDVAPEKRFADALGAAPTTTSGLRYLAAVFQKLARAVDGADSAPTPDATQGYATHRALLDSTLGKWATFRSTNLPELNARLQANGIAPIAP